MNRYKYIIFFNLFISNKNSQQNGYDFSVYTTESCPKNQTDISKRSFALNCNGNKNYLCVPNQNFTKLMEICYIESITDTLQGETKRFKHKL